MLDKIIKNGELQVFIEGKEVDIDNANNLLLDTITDCYLAPCMAMADEEQLNIARNKGVWLEISFNELQTYKDFDFEKLLITLLPKHDFLVLHRYIDGKYQGKSITVNLLYKTTELYKYIKDTSKEDKNGK